jgi:hypothetical protein
MQNNTHLAPRTIREWLELIPFDRAKKEAIQNYDPNYVNRYGKDITIIKVSNIYYALQEAFQWSVTAQKYTYWDDIWHSLKRMESSIKLKTKQDAP